MSTKDCRVCVAFWCFCLSVIVILANAGLSACAACSATVRVCVLAHRALCLLAITVNIEWISFVECNAGGVTSHCNRDYGEGSNKGAADTEAALLAVGFV